MMYNGSQHRVNPITVTDNSKIHMKKNIAIVFTMGLAIASLSLLNGCCTKAAASSKPKPAMVASVGPTASDCGPSIVGPLGPTILGPQSDAVGPTEATIAGFGLLDAAAFVQHPFNNEREAIASPIVNTIAMFFFI